MLIVFEMMVLVGGLCVFNVNINKIKYGVFIKRFGMLSNDFFMNLLDMRMEWKFMFDNEEVFEGIDCKLGKVKWIVICVDLIFGFNL